MTEWPMISCIMPTMGKRHRFVERAVKYFNSQDWPNKELIVVDECDAYGFVYTAILAQDDIQTISIDADIPITVGAKRNLACSVAKGDIIAYFDDDDWYSPQYLSQQAEPILAGRADVTALKMSFLLDARSGALWQCSDEIHKTLFNLDVKCGTMMYKASYLNDLCYPNTSRGEDYDFLCKLLQSGARLEPVTSTSYICVRHGDNVTADIDGLGSPGWQQVPLEQYIPEQDRAFYAGLRDEVKV